MTKTVNLNDVSIQTTIALASNGDEVIVEENGEPVARITAIEKPKTQSRRVAGLGKGEIWMSDDFDDELPDEFWGFDKEL